MKTTLVFNIGAGLSGMLFLIAVFSTVKVIQIMEGQPGSEYSWAMWLMVLLLAGWIALAFWLKSLGKLLAANIMIWLPAVPMVIVGGLALLFIIHDTL
jgi:hypothetical protein